MTEDNRIKSREMEDTKMKDFNRIYDLDNTLIIPIFKRDSPFLRKHFWTTAKDVNKEDVKVILTGRHIKDAELTWATIKQAGYKNVHTVFFNPKEQWDMNHMSTWKAKMLKWLGAKEYIDNNDHLGALIKLEIGGRFKCLSTSQLK